MGIDPDYTRLSHSFSEMSNAYESYFQVNRPCCSGTAMLIGVHLSHGGIACGTLRVAGFDPGVRGYTD